MRRFIKIDNDYFEAFFKDERIFYENGSIASRITPSEYYILKTKISFFDVEALDTFLLKFNNNQKNSLLDIYNIDEQNKPNSIFRLYNFIITSITYITNEISDIELEIYADYSECTNDTSNNFIDIIKHIRNKRIELLGIKN